VLSPLKILLATLCSFWLVAGLIDYACHRRTHIELTSGVGESLLHVAQFLALGFSLLFAIGTTVTPLSFTWIVVGVTVHAVLAFVDVAYTDQRRRISPLEQQVHGYLDVLPLVGMGLFAVDQWGDVAGGSRPMQWTLGDNRAALIGLGIYVVLVGAPIVEELLRTMRYRRTLKLAANTTIGRSAPELLETP
jgi:hypothetical protein